MKFDYGVIHFYKNSEYAKCLELLCECGHKVSGHTFNTYTGMSYKSGGITVGRCGLCDCQKFRPTKRAGGFAAGRVKNKGSVKAANR